MELIISLIIDIIIIIIIIIIDSKGIIHPKLIRMGSGERSTIMNWVDSAQDRDYWRALVNVTLHLRVP